MRDILFINPPSHSDDYYFPIGLGLLNEICRSHDIDSEILDIQSDVLEKKISWPRNFDEAFETYISGKQARTYGFSIMNVGFPWAIIMAKVIRKLYPSSKIIFGGPHMTLLGEHTLETYDFVDVIAKYEGEKIIVPLVNALKKGSRLGDVKNILYRSEQGETVATEKEELIKELDDLPLFSIPQETAKEIDLLAVEAGRGCPFHCYFCSSHSLWTRSPRFKSPERLIKESEHLLSMRVGAKNEGIISFEHDNFLANRKFLRDFLAKKIESSSTFLYVISGSINLLNDEIIADLAESGCASIFMGLETGSQRIQDISKKKLKVNTILPRVKKVVRQGINVTCNLIIGYPEETLEEMYMTLELSANLIWAGAKVNISLMCPEPGSELHMQSDEKDYVLLKDSRYYKELVAGGSQPEHMERISVFYLLTLKNAHYSIRHASNFSQLFTELIEKFPVTTYKLLHEIRLTVNELYNYFIGHYDHSTIEIDKNYQVIVDFLQAAIRLSGLTDEHIRRIYSFERSKWLLKFGIVEEEMKQVSTEFVDEYWQTRRQLDPLQLCP